MAEGLPRSGRRVGVGLPGTQPMQTKRILGSLVAAIGIFLGAAALRAAEPGIEFTGYVQDDKGLSFALRSVAGGNTKWVAIGKEFEDFTVKSFDDKSEVLIVTKGGAEFRLPLVVSKVKLGSNEPPSEIKRKILNNLRQLAAASDQYYLENGVSRANYNDLVGQTKYVREINPVAGEEYRSLQFVQGKKIEVTTSEGYIMSYLP